MRSQGPHRGRPGSHLVLRWGRVSHTQKTQQGSCGSRTVRQRQHAVRVWAVRPAVPSSVECGAASGFACVAVATSPAIACIAYRRRWFTRRRSEGGSLQAYDNRYDARLARYVGRSPRTSITRILTQRRGRRGSVSQITSGWRQSARQRKTHRQHQSRGTGRCTVVRCRGSQTQARPARPCAVQREK